MENQQIKNDARVASLQAGFSNHNEFAQFDEDAYQQKRPPRLDLEKRGASNQHSTEDEEAHYQDNELRVGMPDDFEDIGHPHHADEYFETNPNDLSYTYENTGRDMIIDEGLASDFQSE